MIRYKKPQFHIALLLCILLLPSCAGVSAQTFSEVLSFQGRLADVNTGKPMPDGQYQVTFKIYDAASDGNNLWQETQTVDQVGGVFSVYLGSVAPFPGDLFADGDRWLALQLAGDPEMAERFQFTPSPWALYAANSQPDDDWTFSGNNIYRGSGNVGIGTTTPDHALDVVTAGERAVFGDATAASGTTYGIYGRVASTSGTGLYGEATATTGTACGLMGLTASSSGGRGVYGEAQSASGWAYGVVGETHCPDGIGVVGTADGDGRGVFGYSKSGWPVHGASPCGSGMLGVLGSITLENGGILTWSNSGVVGTNQGGYGVTGRTLEGVGVYGRTVSGTGVEAYHEDSETQAELATSTHSGYFSGGDVHTTEEYTKAYTTGTASLATPIAYATIDRTTGGVLVGTPNVSSTWNATYSRYEITISGEYYNFNTYVTTVSPIGGDYRASTDSVSGKLLVKVYDSSGNLVQRWFSFVTYKP